MPRSPSPAQTHIIVSYLKSKPPGLTSLSDLINLDLARTLFLGCAALVACHLVIALNLRLPPYASFALVGSMQVLVHGVMFYLSIGAVVQFAHVYLKSVSLSETVSDETIQVRRLLHWYVHCRVQYVCQKNPNTVYVYWYYTYFQTN